MSTSNCHPAAVASVSGLVLFGTTTSLLAKIVYELQGPSLRDGKPELFRKPWAMTTVMFVGMSFCLPLAHFQEWKANKKGAAKRQQQQQQAASSSSSNNALRSPLLEPVEEAVAYDGQGNAVAPLSKLQALKAAAGAEVRRAALLSVPTAFDLVATVLMNVGLLSVTASVYQMMRGAEMLFAALFAVLFLRRKLNKWHLGGIGCCVAGIGLVGAASVLSGEGSQTRAVSAGDMLMGMALIIGSQAVQAAQLTFEDHFMSDAGLGIAPLMIVGYEGLIGAFLMLGVLLPIVSVLPGRDGDGIHEDTADTWHMITHSPAIAVTLAVDMTALLLYNVAGMAVTGHLGAVFRTVLETGRTLFVWVVDLILFYGGVGGGKLGESWSGWSWMQLGGFAVLVAGTLVYGRGDEAEGAAMAAAEAAAAAAAGAEVLVAATEEEVVAAAAAAAPPSSSYPSDQLLPPAAPAAAGPLESQPLPVTMRRRTSTSTPISVIGTPMSFKSTMNINHFSSSYVAAGSLNGSLQPGSWGRGLVSSPPSRPQPRGSNGV